MAMFSGSAYKQQNYELCHVCRGIGTLDLATRYKN